MEHTDACGELGFARRGCPLEVACQEGLEKAEKAYVRRSWPSRRSASTAGSRGRSATSECEIGLLPRAHGSAIFTRGETQAIVTATLGGNSDEQAIDAMTGEYTKRFMLHYNFPPFSVGEVRPISGPGRREIGHGHLAERGDQAVMP